MKASDWAAVMNDMSSPRRAASAVASAEVARAADRSPPRTCSAAWFARIRTSNASAFRRRAIAPASAAASRPAAVVALHHRQVDLDEQRFTSDGVVCHHDGRGGHRSSGLPRSRRGFSSTARDRPPSPDPGRRHRGRQGSSAERGADVVRFEIQLIEPGEPGRDVRMCDIDLSEPAEAGEVGEVGAPRRRLLVRLEEPQQRELAHASRAADTAPVQLVPSRMTNDRSTRLVEDVDHVGLRSPRSAWPTVSAASRLNEPANTDRQRSSARSSRSRRSWLQAMVASSVWWRNGAVLLPPTSRWNRSFSRSTSCSRPRVRRRTAASSIARGIPSRRRARARRRRLWLPCGHVERCAGLARALDEQGDRLRLRDPRPARAARVFRHGQRADLE